MKAIYKCGYKTKDSDNLVDIIKEIEESGGYLSPFIWQKDKCPNCGDKGELIID